MFSPENPVSFPASLLVCCCQRHIDVSLRLSAYYVRLLSLLFFGSVVFGWLFFVASCVWVFVFVWHPLAIMCRFVGGLGIPMLEQPCCRCHGYS